MVAAVDSALAVDSTREVGDIPLVADSTLAVADSILQLDDLFLLPNI
jgi:hypothetical protein